MPPIINLSRKSKIQNLKLQRAKFASQFRATARETGFDRADAYLKRRGDLLVSKTFNVSQNDDLSVGAAKRAKRVANCSFAFVRQRLLLRIARVSGTQACAQGLLCVAVR